MRVFDLSVTFSSEQHTDISDITALVSNAIHPLPISAGIALVNTLHTTCAIFINEYQGALVDDVKTLVERLVPERNCYRHDDPRVSDCERGNAHAHLRAALLGRSVAVGMDHGHLALGRFQSIVLAEFDGPRRREISIHVIGE